MTGLREIMWRRVMDDLSFEHARIALTPAGCELTGTVLIAEAGVPLRVDYLVVCDPQWRTRQVAVVQTHQGRTAELRLDHDGNGAWRLNAQAAPQLDGCSDVDLGVSPSTNALPVKRLALGRGGVAEIRAAWVRFPSLDVTAATQAYERLGEAQYRYRSLASGFEAILDVDEDGLPIAYSGVWRRLANGAGAPSGAAARIVNGSFIDALVAPGPSGELARAADDFGWLIGGWAGEVRDFEPDGRIRRGKGEWWFAWVLEGRAMQDVWIVPRRSERALPRSGAGAHERYGSTIRRFDCNAGRWNITWVNPVSGVENRLTGARVGDRIVLDGETDGKAIRWSFTDIADNSFRWLGERRDGVGAWIVQSEFHLHKMRA